ncbi:DUF2948 family protein [Methylosinus sp. Ce-a6]|uniref:DUF2948 family protein n=1 Tax=Methylosinus sp. Ce-a6 TaxID=2172005 RepID=UPI00135A284F|nr:DUF2948 family protein [Methylosinus sp. Ce-a6]
MFKRSSSPQPEGLRLQAMDAEDLSCLSALLQDALVRVGDIAFLPEKRRFAFVGCRYDWAAAEQGRRERCHSGVHFDGVRRVRRLKIALDRPEAILELLAVTFEPAAEPPGGVVTLIFAGGAAISLDVECVEARLQDLGSRWGVRACPSHELDEDGEGRS